MLPRLKIPDVAYLRAVLRYDPITGNLWWLGGSGKVRTRPAGMLKDGYVRIKIDGVSYYAHRICWAIYYGVAPELDVDHWDEVKNNNRILNLRHATRAQNAMNRSIKGRPNKTGFPGVRLHPPSGKWAARIRAQRKEICLGYFNTPEEAGLAYQEALNKYHGQFARTT